MGQQFGLFQKLDQNWLDEMARLRPTETLAPPITLITITEADIAQQKQWPLNDATLATLLQRIQQAKPRVVGLNIYRNIAIAPGTTRLQQTIQSMPNLIGIEKIVTDPEGPAIAPHPSLQAQNQTAASDIVLDSDGKIRRHLISLRTPDGDMRLSLGAKLAMQYLAAQGIESKAIGSTTQLGQAKIQALTPSSGGYVGADMGGYQILSHFLPLESIPRLTLGQVLAGEGTALIKDRIVIIGSTASSLQHQFHIPRTQAPGPGLSGLELQADLAGQLLLAATQGRAFIQGAPPWLGWIEIVAATTIGLAISLQVEARHQFWLSVAIGLASLFALSYGLFLLNWWIITIAPSLTYLTAIILGRQLRSQTLIQQTQAQLQNYSQSFVTQLAEEVEAHARTLAQAASQATNPIANKPAEVTSPTNRDLLAFLGHELRTPLNSIVGYGQLMAAESALPDQYRTSIDTINNSSEYLLKLVNELLEFSRFESTKSPLNRNKIHLPSFLKQIESLFRLQAKKSHLKFRCTSNNTLPDYIWADEIKLRQVLINLVNNALKFTQSGHVIVRAWGKDQMYFEVEDTGPGIASHDLTYIFEAFRQGPDVKRQGDRSSGFYGVGLGLWISQSLVTLMEGEITVVSKLGEGSKFRITLPLHPVDIPPETEKPTPTITAKIFVPKPERPIGAESSSAQPIEIPTPTLQQPLHRILVVDDVIVNRRLISKFLEGMGIEVQEASSGEEAIELWQTWHPHLILMDLYMPGIGGCEAVRVIRQKDLLIPIWAVTANAQMDSDMAIAAGCHEVIAKPIRREELLIRIKDTLQI